jgi:hypothetical protein
LSLATLLFAAFVALFPGWVFAQVGGAAAAVNGTVTDTSGAVIPAATVQLHDMERNVDKTTQTNEAGYYVLVELTPGKYTLRISKQGFATAAQAPFTLVVNQRATIDFSLSVGSTTQTVTVQATAAALQASTAELGTAILARSVNDLPLNGRNFTELLTLTPGVSPISVAQNSSGYGSSPVGSFTFPSVNGQTNRSNLYLLDGINNQGSYVNTYGVAPNLDMLEEFKVQSHNDTAEFGGVLGGVVNVVSKSGTNELHGSAWEFLRNNALDARNPFLSDVTPYKQNQFGAAIGGPVILPGYNGRNKTFFYAAYEGYRNHTTAGYLFVTPTPEELAGDFSGAGVTIYNPFSTRPDPANPGEMLRDPFPNNQIPSNLLDANMALYAKAFFPAPVYTGVAGFNGVDNTPAIVRQDEASLRLDENLGNKTFLWIRYTGFTQPSSVSAGLPGVLTDTYFHGYNAGAGLTRSFGSSAVASFVFGRMRLEDNSNNVFLHASDNLWQQAGFSPNFVANLANGSPPLNPGISFAEYVGIPGGAVWITPLSQIYQYRGDFSKVAGHHNFKMGADFATNNQDSLYGFTDSESYIPFQTANLEAQAGTGNSLASLLLGVPNSASQQAGTETLKGGWEDGFYFQDNWRVTSRLTFNWGIRYDQTLRPLVSTAGKYSDGDFDMTTGTYILSSLSPSCAVTGHAPCIPGGTLPDHVVVSSRSNHSIIQNTFDNWGPRIGLAYRLRDKTVVRTSYGRFYDDWAAVTQETGNYAPDWPAAGVFMAQNLNTTVPTVTAENPAPSIGVLPTPTPFGSIQCWCVDPKIKNPYADEWNFGVQHQLTPNTLITASYVGSHGSRLDLGLLANTAVTPGPGDVTAREPFPYLTPQYWDQSVGRSSYNAFQFTLDKHFSNGLTYLVAYTWSKSMDISCSGWFGSEGCSTQNPYDVDADRSVSGFDLTHMLSLSWVYELPFGSAKRFQTGNKAMDYLIGGWEFNGISRFTSGTPYAVGISGDVANTGNIGNQPYGYERLNLVGNPTPSNQGPNHWLNTSAFAAPPLYTFGDLGRNALRTDWFKDFDLSVFRKFRLGETKSLEFRAEFFNAFNTPVWGAPISDFSNPNFGIVNLTASTARQIQFGLKLYF